jgi:glutaredoxin
MTAKTPVLLTVALLGGLLVLPVAYGVKLYKWVDQNGNVSYEDHPPPSDTGIKVESRDIKIGGGGSDAANKVAEKYPVVLYTAPECTACELARAYLGKRKVPYTDKNVQTDPTAMKELHDKTGALTVPTITVGSKVMRGYLQSLLAGELDAAGYPKIETAAPSEEQAAPEQSATEPGQQSQ